MNALGTDMNWPTIWAHLLRLPPGVPQWLIAGCGLVFIYLLVIFPSATVMAFLDRKLGADFQARVGPNRAGPAGALQPLADLLKLLQKEGNQAWTWREALWVGVHTMALFSTVAVLPLGSLVLLVDTDMSAFWPFWAALVLALGTMLLGFSQGSVPGWLGGVRVAAQALAGAFPALVALLCAGVRAGSFKWSVLAGSQGASPFTWAATTNPFELIAMVVFVVAGLILLAIPPMDAALSHPDIQGGVSSYLHGKRLTLFNLSRFYGFFLWSVISVVLFLGGWQLPVSLFSALKDAEAFGVLQFLELVVLLIKTFLLMLLVVWVARVNPRTRTDQVTDFAWKVLSPFSLAALIGVGFWAGWRAL
ncbi:complex I subunit 1 family protein [Bdellovibrionota bacterium FG-1]